jgi:hypothetical protein
MAAIQTWNATNTSNPMCSGTRVVTFSTAGSRIVLAFYSSRPFVLVLKTMR